MKLLFILLSVIFFNSGVCQDVKFIISVNDKTLTVAPDDDNTDKLLTADSKVSNAQITITVNDTASKEWRRGFSIYDGNDKAIKDFLLMKDGSYCIKLSKLKPLLQPNLEYLIYTTAIPSDPQKAMLVKVGRKLVCKIKIL